MKVRITNCGRGVHKRELKGVERFRSDLPTSWYAFTNLDLALGVNLAREVDIVVVSERRIFMVDLKDWHGKITSVHGRRELNRHDKDPSPVGKIIGVARDTYILLKETMAKRSETKNLP